MRYKEKLFTIFFVSSIFPGLHAWGQQTDYPSNPYNNQNLLTEPYDHQNNIFLNPDQSSNSNQNSNTNNNSLYGNSDPGGPGTGGGGGTPDDAGVPIDGGIGFLLAAGAAAGIKKARKEKSKSSF